MPSSGPNYAGSASSSSAINGGTLAWTSPGNATTSNNSYASCSLPEGTTPECLVWSSFGFSIPAGSNILGVIVEIERSASLDGARWIEDTFVSLVSSGAAVGSNHAATGVQWPTTDTFASYGGSSDLWSASLTSSIVNASGFGVALQCSANGATLTPSIDSCRITVYYANDTTMAASLTAVATVSGALTTQITMASACSCVASLSGALSTQITMSTSMSASATLALDTSISFAAALQSVSTLSGALTTAIQLAAGLTASSSFSGDLFLPTITMPSPTHRVFLAEIDAYDPGTSGVITYRFASGYGYDDSGVWYEPRIEQPASLRRDIGSTLFGGRASQSYGELTLVNGDGALNGMAEDFFDGRTCTVKVADVVNGSPLVWTILVATIESIAIERQRVSVRLRDRSASLDIPFSDSQYAGTNSLPNGIEGTPDDIKGQYKPLLFGRVALVAPIAVNTSKLIYQVSSGAVDSVVNVFDSGAFLGRGADYTNQSDMETNQPSAGTFRSWPAGGCFRLRSTPKGMISACVAEKWTHTDISAAGIARRILEAQGWSAGTDWVASDFTALDQKNVGPLGISVEGGETVSALLDRALGSVGAWWGFDYLGRFRCGRIDAPSGPVMTITDDHIIEIDRQPPSSQAVYSTTLKADRNYAVQQRSALAGIVDDARAAWLVAESRDSAIASPSTKTARPLATEHEATTVLSSISQAQAEASRRLSLLSARRDLVTVTIADPLAYVGTLDIGVTVTIMSDAIGYGSGRDMVIIGYGADYQRDYLDLTLWG